MKILMYLPADLNAIKGTNLRFINMARFLSLQGVKVHVVALKAPFDGTGFVFHQLMRVEKHKGAYFQSLRKIVSLTMPDLLFGHTHNSLANMVLMGKFTKIPVVVDLHGDYIVELREQPGNSGITSSIKLALMDKWYNLGIRICEGIIVVCNPLKKRYQRLNRQIFIIPGGVNTEQFAPDINPEKCVLKKVKGRTNIIYSGSFRSYQGIDLLIEAASEVIGKTKGEFYFTFIGDGVNFAAVKTRMERELGEENFQLFKQVEYCKIPKFLSAADILVIPRPPSQTAQLAFPSKLPEYISMGKPLIATDIGDHYIGVRDMETGLLIKPAKEALVEAILKLKDKSLREKLGKNARKHAIKNFSWEILVKKLLEIFENIIKTREYTGR